MLDTFKTIARPNGLPVLMQEEERNTFYWSKDWQVMRDRIRLRDNLECQVCKDQGRVTVSNLIVHHIKPIEFYPELKLTESNLVTVCLSCHNAIHFAAQEVWDDEWW